MNYLFTIRSKNPKTGPIPVTMSDRSTCPDCCPLKLTAEGVKKGVDHSMSPAVRQGVHDAWKLQEAQRKSGAKFAN